MGGPVLHDVRGNGCALVELLENLQDEETPSQVSDQA